MPRDSVFTDVSKTHKEHGNGETKIDLNRAPLEELAQIPGIGPAMAREIIRYREEHGGFKNLGELDNVYGFGGVMVDKVKRHATVE